MTDAAGSTITAPDLLTRAIDIARKHIEAEAQPSTKKRIHILWAAAKQVRELGASKVVHDAFMALAIEVNLIDKNGRWTGADVRESIRRYGAQDVSHAISWALRGWNPFEKGPLK
ncbi:MAG TPA: hypothetical protein VIJ35_09100 [Bradyrhizobium sp.]